MTERVLIGADVSDRIRFGNPTWPVTRLTLNVVLEGPRSGPLPEPPWLPRRERPVYGYRRGAYTDGVEYKGAEAPVRQDLREAHRFILDHVRSPGTWWTGAERAAIAAEARSATRCALCRERRNHLSSDAVQGRHDGPHALPENVVDTVHRIRTDPARLSRSWFDRVIAGGLEVTRYVELVSVTSLMAGLDYFARALGVELLALPPPRPSEPSRHRPAAAKAGGAWVPMIDTADVAGPEADLYGGSEFVPNIVRALSLVPDEVRVLRRSNDAHYVPLAQIPDPTYHRALARPQMELIAARVSALNQCFY